MSEKDPRSPMSRREAREQRIDCDAREHVEATGSDGASDCVACVAGGGVGGVRICQIQILEFEFSQSHSNSHSNWQDV